MRLRAAVIGRYWQSAAYICTSRRCRQIRRTEPDRPPEVPVTASGMVRPDKHDITRPRARLGRSQTIRVDLLAWFALYQLD